jgi:hypothetical protein
MSARGELRGTIHSILLKLISRNSIKVLIGNSIKARTFFSFTLMPEMYFVTLSTNTGGVTAFLDIASSAAAERS